MVCSGFAPPPGARNTAARVFCSIAVFAPLARRRSIAPCAMSWRISSRNLAPAAGESRHMAPNGVAPAPILESKAKRAATISLSRFIARSAASSTPARIAGAIIRAPDRSVAPQPVSTAAAPLTVGATMAASSYDSLGVRRFRFQGAPATRGWRRPLACANFYMTFHGKEAGAHSHRSPPRRGESPRRAGESPALPESLRPRLGFL